MSYTNDFIYLSMYLHIAWEKKSHKYCISSGSLQGCIGIAHD